MSEQDTLPPPAAAGGLAERLRQRAAARRRDVHHYGMHAASLAAQADGLEAAAIQMRERVLRGIVEDLGRGAFADEVRRHHARASEMAKQNGDGLSEEDVWANAAVAAVHARIERELAALGVTSKRQRSEAVRMHGRLDAAQDEVGFLEGLLAELDDAAPPVVPSAPDDAVDPGREDQ